MIANTYASNLVCRSCMQVMRCSDALHIVQAVLAHSCFTAQQYSCVAGASLLTALLQAYHTLRDVATALSAIQNALQHNWSPAVGDLLGCAEVRNALCSCVAHAPGGQAPLLTTAATNIARAALHQIADKGKDKQSSGNAAQVNASFSFASCILAAVHIDSTQADGVANALVELTDALDSSPLTRCLTDKKSSSNTAAQLAVMALEVRAASEGLLMQCCASHPELEKPPVQNDASQSHARIKTVGALQQDADILLQSIAEQGQANSQGRGGNEFAAAQEQRHALDQAQGLDILAANALISHLHKPVKHQRRRGDQAALHAAAAFILQRVHQLHQTTLQVKFTCPGVVLASGEAVTGQARDDWEYTADFTTLKLFSTLLACVICTPCWEQQRAQWRVTQDTWVTVCQHVPVWLQCLERQALKHVLAALVCASQSQTSGTMQQTTCSMACGTLQMPTLWQMAPHAADLWPSAIGITLHSALSAVQGMLQSLKADAIDSPAATGCCMPSAVKQLQKAVPTLKKRDMKEALPLLLQSAQALPEAVHTAEADGEHASTRTALRAAVSRVQSCVHVAAACWPCNASTEASCGQHSILLIAAQAVSAVLPAVVHHGGLQTAAMAAQTVGACLLAASRNTCVPATCLQSQHAINALAAVHATAGVWLACTKGNSAAAALQLHEALYSIVRAAVSCMQPAAVRSALHDARGCMLHCSAASVELQRRIARPRCTIVRKRNGIAMPAAHNGVEHAANSKGDICTQEAAGLMLQQNVVVLHALCAEIIAMQSSGESVAEAKSVLQSLAQLRPKLHKASKQLWSTLQETDAQPGQQHSTRYAMLHGALSQCAVQLGHLWGAYACAVCAATSSHVPGSETQLRPSDAQSALQV